jgi:hypothetical protein
MLLTKQLQRDFISIYDSLGQDDYSGLYKLMSRIVKTILNKEHPKILLGLLNLGFSREQLLGGFFLKGTNEIYLNKTALTIMKREISYDQYKAYLFYLLLHEYLHAIGYLDEEYTRELTSTILANVFPRGHILERIATKGLQTILPYNFQGVVQPEAEDIINPEYILIRHRFSEYTYI